MKIQMWNLGRRLFFAVLFLALLCLPADVLAKEPSGMITGFEKVSDSCITLSYHVSLEELKKKMPDTIGVYLDGAKEAVQIPADWQTDVDYNSSGDSFYLFMAKWDEGRYPLSPGYSEQGYFPFVEVEIKDAGMPMAIAASSGISNIVARAYQQVDIAWTPLKQVKGYTGLNGKLTTTYSKGTTYHGMPYGQLVDSGKYVPHDASFDTFLAAVNNKNSVFYKKRGSYGTRNSTYYGNDCSAFVSYAYGLPRMTTGMIDASSQFTRVSKNSIYNAKVGDCFNKSTSHVELITGMLYDSSGKLVTVEVCEQTPPKARKVRYSPSQVQSILDSGYVLLRYKGRDDVRPPYDYEGYSAKTDKLAYIGDKFFASIVNKSSGKYTANDGAGNVSAMDGAESADRIWYFEAQGDGTYIITSCKDGKCMGVHGSGTANGTNVEVGGYSGSSSQRWYLYKSGKKYKLVAANGSNVLNLTDGTNMTMWDDTGKGSQGFEILTVSRKGSVHAAAVTLDSVSYVYDGTAKEPAVKVEVGDTVLQEGTDYLIAYSDNIEAGTAAVTITGTGEYTGEYVQNFKIKKMPQSLQVTLSSNIAKEGDTLNIAVSGNLTGLKFSSSDTSVAKVDQNGTVTCLKAGTAGITIKAVSDKNHKAETRTAAVTVEHEYETKTIPPTCVEKGYTTYTCLRCGDVRTEDYVEAAGHKSESETVTEPTCTTDGKRSGICSVCGESYEEVLPALGHAYGEWKNNGDGTHTRTCMNDSSHTETGNCTYEYMLIGKVADNQDGTIGYRCTVCTYFYTKTVTRENCIHELTEIRDVSEATCTQDGCTGNTCCAICGQILEKGDILPALGHTWDGGAVTKEAAIGKEGEKTFTCTVCGETRKEVLAALENPLVPGAVKKDTASGGIYRIGNDRASVLYCAPVNAKKKNVTIPDTVKIEGISCKVVGIDTNAFKNNQKLQTVSIGKNVQEIKIGAFLNCRKLTTVSGGKGVKAIRKNAFSGCTKLKKVTIGSKVTVIGTSAFKGCRALTEITLPAKLTTIGKQAFYGCSGLKKIKIKTTSLKSKNVGAGAFRGIGKKAVAVVPKKVLKSYTKLLKAKGLKGKVRK